MQEVHVQRRPPPEWRCVYCHDDILEAPIICPGCRALLHSECFDELGACGTIGCIGASEEKEVEPWVAPLNDAQRRARRIANIAMALCALLVAVFVAMLLFSA